jgi:diguanylate cyclase (GGDEF)-like protein
METILRVQINAFCVILLVIVLFSTEKRRYRKEDKGRLDLIIYRLLVISTIALLVLDGTSWLLDGLSGSFVRIGLFTANSLYYLMHGLPTALYFVYADYQIYRDRGRCRRMSLPLGILVALIGVAALSSPWTGLLFTINDANRYVRGVAFPAFAVLMFGMTGLSLLLVLLGRKKTSRRTFWTLLAYPLPVLVAALAQDLFYGLVLVWPMTTIFLVTAALNMHRLQGATDHLTGMANRRSLDEELERLIANAHQRGFGGMLIDIDRFKSINDSFGHEMGDRALEDAAEIFKSAVRKDDFAARYGGDEFVLLLPMASSEQLQRVVSRVRDLTAAHNNNRGRPYSLSFSLGAAVYDPSLGETAQQFLARLDDAMYRDKTTKKEVSPP